MRPILPAINEPSTSDIVAVHRPIESSMDHHQPSSMRGMCEYGALCNFAFCEMWNVSINNNTRTHTQSEIMRNRINSHFLWQYTLAGTPAAALHIYWAFCSCSMDVSARERFKRTMIDRKNARDWHECAQVYYVIYVRSQIPCVHCLLDSPLCRFKIIAIRRAPKPHWLCTNRSLWFILKLKT